MSNTYYETEKISLTAFVSKEKNSLQITMPYDKDYTCLNEQECIELVVNILLRVNGLISATGAEEGIKINNTILLKELLKILSQMQKNESSINQRIKRLRALQSK